MQISWPRNAKMKLFQEIRECASVFFSFLFPKLKWQTAVRRNCWGVETSTKEEEEENPLWVVMLMICNQRHSEIETYAFAKRLRINTDSERIWIDSGAWHWFEFSYGFTRFSWTSCSCCSHYIHLTLNNSHYNNIWCSKTRIKPPKTTNSILMTFFASSSRASHKCKYDWLVSSRSELISRE